MRPFKNLLLIAALWAGAALIAHAQLFVSNFGTNTVDEYNPTTGAAINASFISGLTNPIGLAISGNSLFVANVSGNTIGEYNLTTGTAINASFVSGLSGPYGLAISGNSLFVTNYGGNTIGEYNLTTGATINASFISGLSRPYGLAAVPEPAADALLAGLAALLFVLLYRRRDRLAA